MCARVHEKYATSILEKRESTNTHTHTRDGSSIRTPFLTMFYGIEYHFIDLSTYYSEKMNIKAVWKDFKTPVQTFKTLGFEKELKRQMLQPLLDA